jgi:demethylmenaquinone methyltransferase/2-methoxy-6-polyprenyl-1,4-benzoquinol methylase
LKNENVKGAGAPGKATADEIRAIFSEVHGRYELVNHMMTLGLDLGWRRAAAKAASREAGAGVWADICTGTGELAVLLSGLAPEGTRIAAVDFSLEMLAEAGRKRDAGRIDFIAARAGTLPFRDETFDLVTMAFATRNINTSREELTAAFAEFHRVLKPGGSFVNLETSQSASPMFKAIYRAYIKYFASKIGNLLTGTRTGYSYLASSIPLFHDAPALAAIMKEAGFKEVRYRRLFLGAAAIHHARKNAESTREASTTKPKP